MRRSCSRSWRVPAGLLGVTIEDGGTSEIARRARGTPRIANRLLRRVRDYAQVRADGRITAEIAQTALDLLEVDRFGLDEIDQKIMLTILEKYAGGPVGLNTVAASIDEEPDTIEEVYELTCSSSVSSTALPAAASPPTGPSDYFQIPRRRRAPSGRCSDREDRLPFPGIEPRRPRGDARRGAADARRCRSARQNGSRTLTKPSRSE